MHRQGSMQMRLPLGKVPPHLLDSAVFRYLGAKREDVVFGPSRGEDAAIVRADGELLALHCDPISGAYSRIGWIAMNIATNDISTRGVKPRWAVTCILLPEASDLALLESICKDMDAAAKELGVAIVGGHSEVTPGLNHPVVIVFPIGVTAKGKYVTSSGAKPGGRIILTKSVAIEGTAILASDRNELLKKEFGEEFTKRCGRFFEKLSVTREALLSFEFGGVQAMHDPTEGGLAGGLNELTDAANLGFRIYEERIPVEPETERICRFFGIDSLRLISSGSLIVVADPESTKGISDRLEERGIRASVIGEIVEPGNRTIIRKNGSEEQLPMPASDEIWKALSKAMR
jgi:hydrogenase expression/formation protein HypE